LKNTCINTIRNLPAIKKIIAACAGFGRTWGRKGSPLHGSHIAFITESNIILMVQDKKSGQISILNYAKSAPGELANTIAAELEENHIAFNLEGVD